jgi:hypothetical protein
MICFQIDNRFAFNADKATLLFLQQYTVAIIASLFGGFKLTTDYVIGRNDDKNT